MRVRLPTKEDEARATVEVAHRLEKRLSEENLGVDELRTV